MELFTTSADLVNLALALGIFSISVAMVYFFINAAGLVKELRKTLDEVNRQLMVLSEITETIKSKVSFMFSYWSVIEKLATKAVGLVQDNVVNKIKSRFAKTAKKVEDYVENYTTTPADVEEEFAPKTTKKTSKKPASAKAKTGKKTSR